MAATPFHAGGHDSCVRAVWQGVLLPVSTTNAAFPHDHHGAGPPYTASRRWASWQIRSLWRGFVRGGESDLRADTYLQDIPFGWIAASGEIVLDGKARRCRPRRRAKLVVDGTDVRLHGARANGQALGDL